MVSKGGVPKGRIIPVYLTDEGDVYPMDFSKAGNSTPLRERESEPQIPAF